MRGLKWENVEDYYAKKLPGVTWSDRRVICIAHLKFLAFSIGSDILEDNEYAQAAYRLVTAEFRKTIEAQAKNPFEIPAQTGWSISGHDAQYLTRITKNCVVSFICRDCGYFGPDWAKATDDHWWFRCYYCGSQYVPWKKSEAKSDYNRIFAIQDPITNMVRVIPALWPATAEDNWLAGMAETFARQIKCPEDLEAFAAKTAVDIQELLCQAGNPGYYQKFEFTKEAQWRFQPPRWGLEHFQHIVKDGFVGDIWRPENWKDIKVFNDWAELAQLLGNIIFIGEQISLR